MLRGLPKITLFALIIAVCCSEWAMAQPGRGGGGRGGFGGTSALGLLGDEKVQGELELVEDQIEAIREYQQEQREAMQEMFSGIRESFRDMSDEERQEAMTDIREKMTQSNKEFEERVFSDLLPHQIDRLKQLMAQSSSQRLGGMSSGNVSDELAEQLGLTDEQMEALKEKAEEVKVDLEAKMAKLREQAVEEILSVLEPAQREKYREIMGESFQFSQNGRFGQRGGQQGRGGDRGGRGGGDRGGRGGDRGGRGGGDRGGRGGGDREGGGRDF
jgi:Spy/CpxP family protein refolding chaperone